MEWFFIQTLLLLQLFLGGHSQATLDNVIELETDMAGKIILPRHLQEHHHTDAAPQIRPDLPTAFNYTGQEWKIRPNSGPMEAYGRPANRYKQDKASSSDPEPPSTESVDTPVAVTSLTPESMLDQQNNEIRAVNGVVNVPIADTDLDPDPDPFAIRRRILPNRDSFLVADEYGAQPIDKPNLSIGFAAPLLPVNDPVDAALAEPEAQALSPLSTSNASSDSSHFDAVSEGEATASLEDILHQADLVHPRKKTAKNYPIRQGAAPNVFQPGFSSGEVQDTAFPLPQCYRTGGGFLCCNKQLEELIYRSNTKVKSKKLSECNIHAFAQTLDVSAQELFQTTFEIIIGTSDFASKTRFKDNLICKTVVENKVILIYATPEPYSLDRPNTPLAFS